MMKLILMSLLVAAVAGSAVAQPVATTGFGAVAPVEDAHERPDPTRQYKIVFDVSKDAAEPGKPAAGLDRVARFVNMLAAAGVSADKRQIIAVLHGKTTAAVLTDQAFGARYGGARNPNAPLIDALEQTGVEVRVCGQALAAHNIAPTEVLPAVQVDLSALVTIAHMQLAGYALLVN